VGGHLAQMGEKPKVKLLVGKPEGKKSLGRAGHMWVINIKLDLVQIEWLVWPGLV
jgi:hypothetical protein